MISKLICSLTVVVALAACGGSEKRTAAEQAQFETVQEGSAPGVTSTIHGPGETVVPMTGTNADTTTAFSLNPNAVTTTQPAGGTIAGSLPVDPYGTPPSAITGSSSTYRPPVTRSTPARTATPSRSQPTGYQPPAETAPAPADTTTTEPSTETASTPPPTDTAPPPPAAKPKKEEPKKSEESEEPEQTDTAPPPPPPFR